MDGYKVVIDLTLVVNHKTSAFIFRKVQSSRLIRDQCARTRRYRSIECHGLVSCSKEFGCTVSGIRCRATVHQGYMSFIYYAERFSFLISHNLACWPSHVALLSSRPKGLLILDGRSPLLHFWCLVCEIIDLSFTFIHGEKLLVLLHHKCCTYMGYLRRHPKNCQFYFLPNHPLLIFVSVIMAQRQPPSPASEQKVTTSLRDPLLPNWFRLSIISFRFVWL